jgi:hypothetical protein
MGKHPFQAVDSGSNLGEPHAENHNPEEYQSHRFRKMTPTDKLQASMRLYYSARELKAAWVRTQNPHFSEKEVQKSVKESFMYAKS